MVDTFGTGTVPDATIMRAVGEVFDLTPRGIIAALDLRKPIYSRDGGVRAFRTHAREDRTRPQRGDARSRGSAPTRPRASQHRASR